MALSATEEQQKIADSILDSVYLKLLSADVTKEVILQMMADAGLKNKDDHRGGIPFLVGKLMFKITENFLNGKEISSQQCCKAIEILKSLDCCEEYEYFDEYSKRAWISSSTRNGMGGSVRLCAVNMAIRKLEQECPNLSELRKISEELDIEL